jgi:predicted peroxiredoxin
MAKLLISGTHGPDDPTRASFPFHIAKGAKEAGYEVAVVLANDGPLLMREAIRESLVGVGMPPLKELFQFAIENNVHVYV